MVSLEGTGENRYNRYIFLPGFEEGDQLVNAIFDAKTKAASLTERIRQNNGIASRPVEVTPTVASSDFRVISRRLHLYLLLHRHLLLLRQQQAQILLRWQVLLKIFQNLRRRSKKLKVLRDNGILSDEEYEAEKEETC